MRLTQDEGSRAKLVDAFRALAATGSDDEIYAALAAAPSQATYSRLWRALCAATEKAPPEVGVAARVFAIPWVIVCGAGGRVTLPCVLPDVGEVVRVLEANGIFGSSRSLGCGNALVALESLEALRPSELLKWAQEPAMHDIPPAEIQLERGAEEVHLRFLVGAAIAPAHLPDVVETGANIGQWGAAAMRAMGAQLAVVGAQVLPLPRPPAGLYSAAYAGRRAGIETAFNLFMSNSVRRFRATVGDPLVALSSHASGELRVTLSSPFDESLTEGFRWPLHPVDDLPEIERSVTSLLHECGLRDPSCASSVLPDHTATGAVLFPTH